MTASLKLLSKARAITFSSLVVFGACSLLLSSCSDKSSNSATSSSTQDSLFSLVPNDCDILITANLDSPAATELRESPLGKLSAAGRANATIPSELPGGIKLTKDNVAYAQMAEQLAKNPLLAEPSKYLLASVVCISGANSESPATLMIAKLKSGASITSELASLEADLRNAGNGVVRSEQDGLTTLKATLVTSEQRSEGEPESASKEATRTWYLVSSAERLIIGNDLSAAQRVAKGVAASSSFVNNAAYAERQKLLGSESDQLGSIYVRNSKTDAANSADSSFMIGNARFVGTRAKGSLQLASFVSPGMDPIVSARLVELSQAAGISSPFETSLKSVFNASFAAKALITSFAKASPEASKELQNLPDISEVVIGLALPSGASPFPDLYGAIYTADPSTVLSALKILLNKQKLLSAWQTQKIADTDVQLALSPIGAGAFLANLGDKVAFATSQPAIEQLISGASKGTAKGSQGSVFRLIVSGRQILELAKALQGTLSMFTGGQTNIDLGAWKVLEQIGNGTMNIIVEPKGVRINGEITAG